MNKTTMSPETLRAELLGRVTTIEGHPDVQPNDWDRLVVNSTVIGNPQRCHSEIERAMPATLYDLSHQLAGLEILLQERQRRRTERDAQDHARTVQPLEPTDPEAIDAAERTWNVNRAAEYRRSTEGRLEAIEGLLGEIRDALVRR